MVLRLKGKEKFVNSYMEKFVQVTKKAKEVMNEQENHNMVIRFFEGLQEYGIKFSDNQRNMLISSTNTLVLGRSGTGKTTISAFKILALDLLFMSYKKYNLYYGSSYKLSSKDFKKFSG